ncbi:MAG: PQQ-binding-like beta-propeller repeat protein [Sedimentisphaerales bacterium]|nr:PQQ-binding-like beta-propeller repeat protein [Sedimentisphaerales bacterium]MBN2843835.1 PQQ-binding-like beta-propeller repeat protein [Sedimentisphaerales bacterium]
MKTKNGIILAISVAVLSVVPACYGDSWPMKQKDCCHTGRADVTIATERLNDTFFDVFLWQTPTPDSPTDGRVGAGSMPFYDGVGPDGADLVVAGYHWPKGVAGLDRHTGELLWSGNPDGGEVIGEITPAFSSDGTSIYIINDYTSCGASLMAFSANDSPLNFRGNQNDYYPEHFESGSPVYSPYSSMIYASQWYGKAYGAYDDGYEIYQVWEASNDTNAIRSEPSIWHDTLMGEQVVISTGRPGMICATNDWGNELWIAFMPDSTDATPTIDPDNGNIYLACGWSDIYVVGLDIYGNSLWQNMAMQVYDQNGSLDDQHASGSGCLSHDGSTYYFQTVANDGSGKLYAINTADGSLKWDYATQSMGSDYYYSCPVITQNNVIIVGNNDNGTYYALLDNGQNNVVLLDTLTASANSEGVFARASATLSSEGIMYLPLCTIWNTANGNGDTPDYTVQNLFCAFDLSEDAITWLYPPSGVRAYAGNGSVELQWNVITDTAGMFDHYAIYRSNSPFNDITGMTPVVTEYDINQNTYLDTDATNDTQWYYAVTTVTSDNDEYNFVNAIGPRTPRDETDLQVVSISRTPYYPRYAPEYTDMEITEPDTGFGPYHTSAATGLGQGQDETTKHLPEYGENITYIATVRNRGTNYITGITTGSWSVDGTDSPINMPLFLAPGATAKFSLTQVWDEQSHELSFSVDLIDDRPSNNSLTIDTMAVGFLTYIDRTFIENFRDVWTDDHSGNTTDDIIDWLNLNAARLNELFEVADCPKRVHYDILEVLDDDAQDPTSPETINFAIFPFRYLATDGDPRLSGYYNNDDDIDYGLLHEMAHQLGMIDVYQLDLPAENNLVNGVGYNAHDDLMRTCAPYFNEFHALAMTRWYNIAHGMYGQFLYDIPEQIQLELTGIYGQPLANAQVTIYQMCDRPGTGKVITDQIRSQGSADENGIFTLPNVTIDNNIFPESPSGEILHDNPFGYVHVVGTNGLLLFKIEYDGIVDYCWLDITQANVAYWKGYTSNAVFPRQLNLGGEILGTMPLELTEINADDWMSYAESASGTLSLDNYNSMVGSTSIRFETNGGFDTYIRYPGSYQARWDLSEATNLYIWFYAENDTGYGFQNNSPWIRLYDNEGDYLEYRWYQNGEPSDFLNTANYQWKIAVIDLYGEYTDNGWNHTLSGEPDLTSITALEIHADTWDYGFKLWVDGIHFNWEDYRYVDFATDSQIDIGDLEIFANNWLSSGVSYPMSLGTDLNADGSVDMRDLAYLAANWLAE